MKFMGNVVKTLILAVAGLIMLPMADVHAEASVLDIMPPLTEETFDYEWYLKQHPDLAAIVPADDYDTIWAFYETIGEPSGWRGRVAKTSYFTEYGFDYETFLGMYPDVYAAFGTNYDMIYDWYLSTGIYEGRIAKTYDEEINALLKVYDVADSIIDNSMSTREKVKAVHDWMCVNIDYDIENLINGTLPDSSYYMEGPMEYGLGVCNGYMLTFQAFMEVLGIESENIASGWAEIESTGGGHAWNRVNIDGEWYEIDVTWDDLGLYDQGYNYNYFLISQEQMDIDHAQYRPRGIDQIIIFIVI